MISNEIRRQIELTLDNEYHSFRLTIELINILNLKTIKKLFSLAAKELHYLSLFFLDEENKGETSFISIFFISPRNFSVRLEFKFVRGEGEGGMSKLD